MRIRLHWLILIVTAVVSAWGQNVSTSLRDRFDSQQAYTYTSQVVSFGEPWPGTPGHAKTEKLIHDILKKDGAQIEGDDFTATTPTGFVPVHNIIGKFNVSTNPKQPIFILAGHYDTLHKAGFVGANDGGSSTAILLSFADALAHQKMKMQIWLVWTDLEEGTFVDNDGLYGSRHLARKLKDDGTSLRVKGFFLLDMIGDKQLNIARETQSTRALQDVIATAAKQLGYSSYFFQYETGITDDHVEFLNVGIPQWISSTLNLDEWEPNSTAWESFTSWSAESGTAAAIETFRATLSLASWAIERGTPRLHDSFNRAAVLARTRFPFAVVGGEMMLKFTQFPVDALVIAQR